MDWKKLIINLCKALLWILAGAGTYEVSQVFMQ
jgi:hypothetical protein